MSDKIDLVPGHSPVTVEQKKRELFLRQKETLDLFLERGAISRAQYDKSLRDLAEKMMFGRGTQKVEKTSLNILL